MKQNLKNISKYKYAKKKLQKNEIKIKILKSILQNNYLKNSIKLLAQLSITNINTNNNKNKKICLLLGRQTSIFKKFNLCRHKIKKLNILNRLPGVKTYSL